MSYLIATFKIVTPMFAGDAHQQATDLRMPEIKHALRFWWRAINWPWAWRKAGGNDVVEALKILHGREGELFGSAEKQGSGGQCIFTPKLTYKQRHPMGSQDFFNRWPTNSGHKYLMGQGIYDPGSKKDERSPNLLRTALDVGEFALRIMFRRNVEAKDIRSVVSALFAFGLLGGLGARSRRGFGSIALHKIQGYGLDRLPVIPVDSSSYKDCVAELISSDLPKSDPLFSAFFAAMRIDMSKTGRDAWPLLGRVGQQLQLYRRSDNGKGNDGRIISRVADLKPGKRDGHPGRVVFGLPHNYFLRNRRDSPDKVDVNGQNMKRRASPLFVHIHQFPDNSCVAVQYILRSQFLPSGKHITMQAMGKDANDQYVDVGDAINVEPTINWNLLHEYLDQFNGRVPIYDGRETGE